MATVTRQPQLSEALQFRPRWWWDPVPDWVLDSLSAVTIREIALIQMKNQLETMKVQQAGIEEAMGVLRKAK